MGLKLYLYLHFKRDLPHYFLSLDCIVSRLWDKESWCAELPIVWPVFKLFKINFADEYISFQAN